MLTEYETDRWHYFLDAKNRFQGEAKWLWDNGNMWEHCFYVDAELHGECKRWDIDGKLRYHYFYVNGKVYRELLVNPVDDKDKFLITIETGGKWLC